MNRAASASSSSSSSPSSVIHHDALDRVILSIDNALRTSLGSHVAVRPCPRPENVGEAPALSAEEKRLSAALMRVNHVGEVCAQALYASQAWGTTDPALKAQFRRRRRRRNRSPGLDGAAPERAGRAHQPAQPAVVCGLVRHRPGGREGERPPQPGLCGGDGAPGRGPPQPAHGPPASGRFGLTRDRGANARRRGGPRRCGREGGRGAAACAGAGADEAGGHGHDDHGPPHLIRRPPVRSWW